MKANMILTAIAVVMMSSSVFAQALVKEGAEVVKAAAEAGQTASQVGKATTGAASAAGVARSTLPAGKSSDLFTRNSKGVQKAAEQTGAACDPKSGLKSVGGADQVVILKAQKNNLMKKDDTCLKTEFSGDATATHNLAVLLQGEESVIGDLDATTVDKSVAARALDAGSDSLASAMKESTADSDARVKGLCSAKNEQGQLAQCANTAAFCDLAKAGGARALK